MLRPRSIATRPVFVALLVFFAIAAGLFWGWQEARAHAQADVRARVESRAELAAVRLEEFIGVRLSIAEHLAHHWVDGKIESLKEFEEHSATLQKRFPGTVAINWINERGVITRVVPVEPNRAALGRDLTRHAVAAPLLERAAATGALQSSPPIELYQGGLGFTGYVPVEIDGRLRGFVNVVFRIAPLVERCVAADILPLYSLVIEDAGEPAYSGGSAVDARFSDLAVVRFAAAGSRTWRITVTPTAEVAATAQRATHDTALAGGLLAALLVSAVCGSLVGNRKKLGEKEERFRAIFDAVSDGVVIHDAEGRLLEVNEKMVELFGHSKDELRSLSIRSMTEGSPPYTEAVAKQHIRDVVSTGRGVLFDWKARHRDGRIWWAELHLQPARIGGEPRVLATIRDVTERKRFEERLRQSQKMQAVGTLAAGVAHDFNNVITAVLGFREMVKTGDEGDSASKSALDGIRLACERAAGVTNSLLMFSRGMSTAKRPVDLCALLRDTAAMLRHMIPSAIKIECEASTDERLWVESDEAQLQQVIVNLAVNARDALPSGGTLRISCRGAEGTGPLSERSCVELHVEDDGEGMPEHVLARALEPFFTTKPREHGTGLGLAVAHGIVVDHGGSISIDSRPGRGTSVTIALPRCDAPPPVRPGDVERPAASSAGARVLVVEDNPQVRNVVCGALAGEGLRVTEAVDGIAALEKFEADGFDLAVIDVDLPRLGGIECLSRMRRIAPSMPAILVSGLPEEQAARMAGDGVVFMQKPFHLAELRRVASELLAAAPVG